MSKPNVYLIGPMGSGKTSIGQKLSRLLDLEFLDCDHELEKQTGASINLIFDVEGEEGFRKRETGMLEKLTQRDGILLATGGGAVLSPENRKMLSRSGLVIYLQTSVSQQMRRLRMDKTRPLLRADDREVRLEELAAHRNPLYEEIADFTCPARNRSLDATAQALAEDIQQRWAGF